MTTFTVIGTGTMANAIGGLLTDGGSQVTLVARSDIPSANLESDVVVLAIPYSAVAETLAVLGGRLDGTIIVDITNPLDFATFDSLTVPAGGSAAAEIQAALPGSIVLKAFNTTFAATLVSKQVGDARTTVLVAGDDSSAKSTLLAAIEAGGVDGLDAGSLKRARELEALGFLQLTLAADQKIGWTGGFALVT